METRHKCYDKVFTRWHSQSKCRDVQRKLPRDEFVYVYTIICSFAWFAAKFVPYFHNSTDILDLPNSHPVSCVSFKTSNNYSLKLFWKTYIYYCRVIYIILSVQIHTSNMQTCIKDCFFCNLIVMYKFRILKFDISIQIQVLDPSAAML